MNNNENNADGFRGHDALAIHPSSTQSNSADHRFTEVESDISEMMSKASLPLMVVHHDVETGEVLCSENGGPFVRAHAAIRAMVTGEPYRDPGPINPLTAGKAEVRSMLLYLARYYQPSLANHPDLTSEANNVIEALRGPIYSGSLSELSNNYERWDRFTSELISIMED